jgi:hypothetical protein
MALVQESYPVAYDDDDTWAHDVEEVVNAAVAAVVPSTAPPSNVHKDDLSIDWWRIVRITLALCGLLLVVWLVRGLMRDARARRKPASRRL